MVTARCLTCGATWTPGSTNATNPPPCFGTEGHEHRLFADGQDPAGAPIQRPALPFL